MSRAGNWPGGLRWIVRRVKPSRRQMANLTVILSFRVSRGCDLECPVVDSVADGTLAA